MGNFRVMIKTSGGNFIYPADQIAAKIDGTKIHYDLIGNFRTDDRILIRKTGSDKITLEGHIIPTLWSRSEKYRNDRSFVFEDNGSDMPVQTKLSAILNRIVVSNGIEDPIKVIMEALPQTIEYTRSGVSKWLTGEVMLPKIPEALEHIAVKFNSAELLEWHEKLKEQEYLPVKRIRVLHSGIRALLAKPQTHEESSQSESANCYDKNAKQNKADDESQHEKKINTLADAIRLIKDEYQEPGEGLFSEFVTVAKVFSVSEIGLPSVEKIKAGESEKTEVERGIVSFSVKDSERMTSITNKYKGVMLSDKATLLLKKRSELFVNGINIGLYIFADQYQKFNSETRVDFLVLARKFYLNKNTNTALTNEFYKQLLMSTVIYDSLGVIFNCIGTGKDMSIVKNNGSRTLLEKTFSNEGNAREKIHNLLGLTNFDMFIEKCNAIDFGYPEKLLDFYKQAYSSSQVLRHLYGTFNEFLNIFDLVDNSKKSLKECIEAYRQISKDRTNFENDKKTFLAYANFLSKIGILLVKNNEFNENIEKINALKLPVELSIAQDAPPAGKNIELIQKVLSIYGVEKMPEYQSEAKKMVSKHIKINFVNDDKQTPKNIVTDFNMF